MPVIGFLNGAVARAGSPSNGGFRQGLKETGFVEGQNVTIDYRWAEGQFDRLPATGCRSGARRVAVIARRRQTWRRRLAKAATTTVPIVFTTGGDPVSSALSQASRRPGSNVTGVNFFDHELTAKRLDLLRELVPEGYANCRARESANSSTTRPRKEAQAAARAIGTSATRCSTPAQPRDRSRLSITCARTARDALFVAADALFHQSTRTIGHAGGIAIGFRRSIRCANTSKSAG